MSVKQFLFALAGIGLLCGGVVMYHSYPLGSVDDVVSLLLIAGTLVVWLVTPARK